jgi:hypothetical protein
VRGVGHRVEDDPEGNARHARLRAQHRKLAAVAGLAQGDIVILHCHWLPLTVIP